MKIFRLFFYPDTNIKILNVSPITYFQRNPAPDELVFDARKLSDTQWNGMEKHFEYESDIRAKHTARLLEWLSVKGRSILGRLPMLEYTGADNMPNRRKEADPMIAYVNSRSDVVKASSAVDNHITWGVYSGVELHNLVGWEYVGPEPEEWFEDEGVWWYDVHKFKEMYAASVVANLSRVQWPYTRRSPTHRLHQAGFRYPILCSSYLTTNNELPIQHIDANFTMDTFSGMTVDEMMERLRDSPPEVVAAIVARLDEVAGAPVQPPGKGNDVMAGNDIDTFVAQMEGAPIKKLTKGKRGKAKDDLAKEKV